MYSDASLAPVCQACLEKNYGSPLSGSAKAGRGHSKVVTFGGVTEIEQPIDTVVSNEGEQTELLRRLLSKATVAMPTTGLGSQLSEGERRYGRGQIENNLVAQMARVACISIDCTKEPKRLFCCITCCIAPNCICILGSLNALCCSVLICL